MDDMTPTDKLRALLDERGVEWEDDSPVPSMKPWKTSFTSFTGEEVTISAYDEPKWLMGTMVFHTPEQAIAATVGPMLDQDLQQALDFMRIWITDDAHLGESAISYELEKAEGLRKLEAIEQAIAATVGVGTCRNERTATIVKVPHKDYISIGHYECGLCGASITPVMRYCHGCGARLKGASE